MTLELALPECMRILPFIYLKCLELGQANEVTFKLADFGGALRMSESEAKEASAGSGDVRALAVAVLCAVSKHEIIPISFLSIPTPLERHWNADIDNLHILT